MILKSTKYACIYILKKVKNTLKYMHFLTHNVYKHKYFINYIYN